MRLLLSLEETRGDTDTVEHRELLSLICHGGGMRLLLSLEESRGGH